MLLFSAVFHRVLLVWRTSTFGSALGWWRKKANVELIASAQQLVAQVLESSAVTFVHVRGHTGEEGNERADRLVQWGKTA
eukprot:SAG11_NODE_7793_length_1095_cov_4.455823_1_plen_79_part_01